jgi:hypothetical protein
MVDGVRERGRGEEEGGGTIIVGLLLVITEVPVLLQNSVGPDNLREGGDSK